jgi:hypothetical protein
MALDLPSGPTSLESLRPRRTGFSLADEDESP